VVRIELLRYTERLGLASQQVGVDLDVAALLREPAKIRL
jgi:hypothetical protein